MSKFFHWNYHLLNLDNFSEILILTKEKEKTTAYSKYTNDSETFEKKSRKLQQLAKEI